MQVNVINPQRGQVQINGAQLVYPRFSGQDPRFGQVQPNFTIVIDDEEAEAALIAAGYSIQGIDKIRPDGSPSWHTLKIKFKYSEKSHPDIYMESNGNVREVHPDHVGDLDRLRISMIDLDIHAFDSTDVMGQTHRSAYLDGAKVYIQTNRFAEPTGMSDSGASHDEQLPF